MTRIIKSLKTPYWPHREHTTKKRRKRWEQGRTIIKDFKRKKDKLKYDQPRENR